MYITVASSLFASSPAHSAKAADFIKELCRDMRISVFSFAFRFLVSFFAISSCEADYQWRKKNTAATHIYVYLCALVHISLKKKPANTAEEHVVKLASSLSLTAARSASLIEREKKRVLCVFVRGFLALRGVLSRDSCPVLFGSCDFKLRALFDRSGSRQHFFSSPSPTNAQQEMRNTNKNVITLSRKNK